jgi:hypothetical protein
MMSVSLEATVVSTSFSVKVWCCLFLFSELNGDLLDLRLSGETYYSLLIIWLYLRSLDMLDHTVLDFYLSVIRFEEVFDLYVFSLLILVSPNPSVVCFCWEEGLWGTGEIGEAAEILLCLGLVLEVEVYGTDFQVCCNRDLVYLRPLL